jgi:zinc protease
MSTMRTRAIMPLLLSVTAVVGAEREAPDLALESYRLPNGLKVALHRDPTVPRVTVCVAYHVGSKNERAGRTGFAHFFEHMMFRGTKNNPNYDIPLQETGAQSNAFTSEDMTVYFETVPTPFLERALYLEAERLAFLDSALDQQKFDTEREVVKNERRQGVENVPYGLSEETILASLFPEGHPYSWSVIGSMKDLDAASLDDLKRFFAEFYSPSNATLVLAGDFDPAEAKRLIEREFGPLAPGSPVKRVEAPAAPAVAKRIEQADKVQLPRVYWSWPTVADDHPDAAALELLATILSDGDASRLHKALVREARLAKDVAAGSDTKEIAGLFQLRATAAEGKPIDAIEAALDEQIRTIQEQPPTAAELERALAQHEKSTYAALTSPLMRAVTLGVGYAQKDDPAYYREEFARIFRVTPEDIRRVARTYLKPEKVVLVIRPAKPDEPETEAIQAGPLPDSDGGEAPAADRTPGPGPDWTKLPGPSEPRPFRAPKFVRKTLSNGLEVWIAPWKVLPVVEVSLAVPVGTGDDPAGKSGLAHLTARLLDQGTRSRTATELAEALDALGVTLSVEIDADDTSFNLGVLARNLEPALELLGEVLNEPRFDPTDVERERALLLADLKQGPDSVGWIARRAFGILLHGAEHPYGNPAQGYPETVAKLSREDASAFYHERFGPKGASLIVVGDLDPEAVTATLERTLGRWKGAEAATKPRPEAAAHPEEGVLYLVDKPGAVQSVLTVGRRWVDRKDPRYIATLVGNRVLGDDFLSRLNQNLRERNGYSYGAGSAFNFRRSGSTWAVSTSVRADATAPALKEVLNELNGLADGSKPLTPDELATAIDAESRSYPESFSSPRGIAAALGELADFDLPDDYLDTFLDQLGAAKRDAIAEAMNAVVDPAERTILVVGDRRSIEPELRKLGFREIRLVTPDGKPVESR